MNDVLCRGWKRMGTNYHWRYPLYDHSVPICELVFLAGTWRLGIRVSKYVGDEHVSEYVYSHVYTLVDGRLVQFTVCTQNWECSLIVRNPDEQWAEGRRMCLDLGAIRWMLYSVGLIKPIYKSMANSTKKEISGHPLFVARSDSEWGELGFSVPATIRGSKRLYGIWEVNGNTKTIYGWKSPEEFHMEERYDDSLPAYKHRKYIHQYIHQTVFIHKHHHSTHQCYIGNGYSVTQHSYGPLCHKPYEHKTSKNWNEVTCPDCLARRKV